jgi:hypothetical protein
MKTAWQMVKKWEQQTVNGNHWVGIMADGMDVAETVRMVNSLMWMATFTKMMVTCGQYWR